MKTFIIAALAVAITASTSTAFAGTGEIVWRYTSTVLDTPEVPVTPGTVVPDPDENGVSDPSTVFGISYPVTTSAAAEVLKITPKGQTDGISFEAVDDLPAGLTLNNGTGVVVGMLHIIYPNQSMTINIRVIKGTTYGVVPLVIVMPDVM